MSNAHPSILDKAVMGAALDALQQNDPVLKSIIEKVGPISVTVQPDAFSRLARAIVGQQISRAAAESVWKRLQVLRPGSRGKLRAEHIATATDEAIRACGVSANKLLSLRDLASHFTDGRINARQHVKMSNEDIIAELLPVRGIGRWTAEMYLMFCLGRTDVLPVDDLGIQNAIMKAYRLRKKPDAKKIRTLAKKWSPYESISCLYLWSWYDGISKQQ